MQTSPSAIRQALIFGAAGYVAKHAADSDLLDAIRRVARGSRYVDPELGGDLVVSDAAALTEEISERERDVLFLLALGYTNQEIAEKLYHLRQDGRDASRPHLPEARLRDAGRARSLRTRERADRPELKGGIMELTLPQFGIFAQGTHAHYLLEFDLLDAVDAAQTVASFARLRAPEVTSGGINLVVAFGRRRVATGRTAACAGRPRRLPRRSWAPTDGGHRRRNTTPGSGSAGASPTSCGSGRERRPGRSSDVAWFAAEQPGFTYLNGRDITGFVDGTANPPVRRAGEVALVPAGRPGEGGSHVHRDALGPRPRRLPRALGRGPAARDRPNEAGQRRADRQRPSRRPRTSRASRSRSTERS